MLILLICKIFIHTPLLQENGVGVFSQFLSLTAIPHNQVLDKYRYFNYLKWSVNFRCLTSDFSKKQRKIAQ